MNEISKIRTDRLWTEGWEWNGTMDGVFDEWSGGVRQGPGECDEVRRDADVWKLRKEAGLQGKWGEWKGMVRTT